MTQIAALRVALEANTANFRKGMSGAVRSLASFTARATAAAAATATAFGVAFKSAADDAGELDNLALRLGTTTEALSELRFVASQAGIDFGTFGTAMQRMVRRIDEVAKTGKGVAAPALESLGLSAEKLSKIPLPKQFEIISERMSKLKTQAERVRLAMALFDTEGVKLVQTMANGAKGIQDARKEARDLGITLSSDTAAAATAAGAEWDKLTSVIKAASQRFLLEFAPEIGAGMSKITSFIRDNLSDGIAWVKDFVGQAEAGFSLFGTGVKMVLEGDVSAGFALLSRLFDNVGEKTRQMSVDFEQSFSDSLIGTIVNRVRTGVTLIKASLQALGTFIGGLAAVFTEFFSGNFSGALAIRDQVGKDALDVFNRVLIDSRPTGEGGAVPDGLVRTNESQLTVLRSIDGKLTNVAVAQ